jgi:hypothetical protein
MGMLPELLLAWAPFVAVVVLWVVVRRGYGRQVGEALTLSRESVELQKRIVSCLEDIRAELKGASTVKGS